MFVMSVWWHFTVLCHIGLLVLCRLSRQARIVGLFVFQHQYHTKIDESLERAQVEMARCLIEKVSTIWYSISLFYLFGLFVYLFTHWHIYIYTQIVDLLHKALAWLCTELFGSSRFASRHSVPSLWEIYTVTTIFLNFNRYINRENTR